MNALKKAFNAYINVLETTIIRQNDYKGEGLLVLFSSEFTELRSLVGKAEKQEAFQNLIDITKTVFPNGKAVETVAWNLYESTGKHLVERDLWAFVISNFFIGSLCYSNVYNNIELDADKLFNDYERAFKAETVEIAYFVPLKDVEFYGLLIDFDDFQIQKFSENELGNILQNNLNKTFYPWAVIDTKTLSQYWFLRVTESISSTKLFAALPGVDPSQDAVSRQSMAYPQKIQSALEVLALFNWGHDPESDVFDGLMALELMSEGEAEEARKKKASIEIPGIKKHFINFNIPFIIKINDNLLDFPQKVHGYPEIIIDKIDDAGYLDIPPSLVFDNEETEVFKQSIKQIIEVVNSAKEEDQCEFIDIALKYLSKAFFSDGMEQLLWHITVIEALFGEKGEVRNKLARRVATVLGDTETKKESLKKQINELYDFRSDFVHGNKFKKDVYGEHLYIARQLARRALLWFLNYLNYLKDNQKEGGRLPDREEILLLLDLKEKKRLSVKELLDSLPQGFPNIKGWIEC